MDKSDIEYLDNCLKHTANHHSSWRERNRIWYTSGDTVLTVARILDKGFYFPTTSEVIDFFESPYKFEKMIQGIIEDFNKEHTEKVA